MIPTPWAAWDLRVFSAVQLATPSVKSRPSSVYSWFWTMSPAFDPDQREVDDAVVVHPPLLLLVGGGVAGVRGKGRAVGDRVTPGDQHLPGVALWHHHGVGASRSVLPAKPSSGRGLSPRLPARLRAAAGRAREELAHAAAQHARRRSRHTAAEQRSPREPGVHDLGEALVVGRVRHHLVVVHRHLTPLPRRRLRSDGRRALLRPSDWLANGGQRRDEAGAADRVAHGLSRRRFSPG